MERIKNKCKWISSHSSISNVSVVLLCTLIAIFNTPIVSRNVPNIILIGLMVTFAVSIFPRVFCLEKEEGIALLLLSLYMVIITAYKLLGISSAALYYYFNIVQYYFFFAAIMMVYKSLTRRQIIIILMVAIGTAVITIISNIYLCLTSASANEYVNLYKTHRYTTNATNTQFATAMLLLAGVSFIGALNRKKRIPQMAMYALCVLCMYFAAAVAQRLTVVILAFLMFPLLLLANVDIEQRRKISGRMKMLLIVAALVVVGLCVFYKPILQWIGAVIGSPRVSKRINQIIVLLETGNFVEAGGSLGVRYELMMTSWKTFTATLSNFFLGIGDHRADNMVIGNHSLVLDELARYGLVFAILSFWLILYSFKVVRKIVGVQPGTRVDKQVLVLFVILILRAVVGALFDVSIGIVLFVVTPLLLRLETNNCDADESRAF